MKKIALNFILLIIFSQALWATVTVDGNAYLENQTSHDSIKVFVERIAPSSLTDSTFTDSNGYYSIDIETGLYNIIYSKDDYFNEFLTEQILYSNTTLSDFTLLEHTTIINVPSMFTKIQGAINRAYENDTVLVATGTYVENIIYNGKNITVASLFLTNQDTSYISQTIIDGNQSGSVVTFNEGSANAVLSGFVIQNGSASDGGGICCYFSSPSLNNVTITGNSATSGGGGGMYCHNYSSPSLNNVTITCNSASQGGGINCSWRSSPSLVNVTITGNSASDGGGICCGNRSSPSLVNLTISGNSASNRGGGIVCFWYCSPSLVNLTISGNSAVWEGGGIYCDYSSPSLVNSIVSDNTGNYGIYNSPIFPGNPTITYSDFYNNQNGNFYNCGEWMGINVTTNANGDSCDVFYNIQMDPLFLDAVNGDYHLSENSPCIDAGDPSSPLDPDGTVADMGAYYYNQQETPAYTNIKVFLEGPYNAVSDIMNYSLTLSTSSPYDNEDIGSLPTVTGHSLVDWIQVKLRTTATGSTVDSCNAFLLEDGSVVDVNGNSSFPFYNTSGNEYYIVIHHRNHLDIMSAVKHSFGISPLDNTSGNENYTKNNNRNRITKNNLVKYTSEDSQRETTNIDLTIPGSIYGDGYQELETGIIGMYSGDINNDGEVTTSDYTNWYNAYITGSSGYQLTDLNMDVEVSTSDYTKWYNNFIVGASSSVPGQTRESSGGSKKIILRKIEKNTKKIQ